MHWPGKQPTTARGLRRLPLEAAHRAAGAAFGQVGGWERPLWFEPGVADPEIRYSYIDPSWFPHVREEVRATREGVALYDLTTYAKFLVAGPGALAGLQRLATSDLDVPVGRIVYTVLANERGGIELDPTITRLAEDTFLVLAPTLTQRRCEGLLRNGLPADAVVTDVTSGFATLHLAGPRSRELLARLTDADIDGAAWPFLEAREIEVGRVARVGVPRVVHGRARLGADGPDRVRRPTCTSASSRPAPTSGSAMPVRSRSTPRGSSAASARGVTTSARSTIRSRPGWASRSRGARRSISSGATALERLRATDHERRLVSVHAPDAVLWHGESMLRDGDRVGHITSASIAPTLGGSVGLAWVHGPVDGGAWQVEIGGDPVPCLVSVEPFYDPRGERLRR